VVSVRVVVGALAAPGVVVWVVELVAGEVVVVGGAVVVVDVVLVAGGVVVVAVVCGGAPDVAGCVAVVVSVIVSVLTDDPVCVAPQPASAPTRSTQVASTSGLRAMPRGYSTSGRALLADSHNAHRLVNVLLKIVRYVLPGLVTLAGIVAMSFGTDTSLEGGTGLIGAGLSIYLINWLFRQGVRGESAREAEERARAYYARHGRWPNQRRRASR
jgi:hypothetical protein